MINIENLTSEHASALDSLIRIALKDYPTAFETDFSQIENRPLQGVIDHLDGIEKSNGFRLGAFDEDGELIGTVRLQPRHSPKRSHCADFMAMFVRSEKRNQGVGRALLETAIEKARQIDGLEQLELSVSSDALSALHVYENVGFQSTGVLRRQIKLGNDYHDYLTMWMPLSDARVRQRTTNSPFDLSGTRDQLW